MFGLFISLALLGLSAIDPVGIAAVLILLHQEHPFERSFMLLSGSFISLMVMGLLFAEGLGQAVLHFEKSHPLLLPAMEVIAGITLLGIAMTLLWRMRTGKLSVNPPAAMIKQLRVGNWQLLTAGALLVAIQSTLDVVFVVAMIRVGQFQLHAILLSTAVATYAVAALALQLIVVLAYKLSPPKQRMKTLANMHRLLVRYADQVLIGVSSILGCILIVLATLS